MNSNLTYEPASRRGGLGGNPGDVYHFLLTAARDSLHPCYGFVWFRQISCGYVECNWQNVSELGVFRVVETVTLEIVNLLWNRDLCATPYVSS